MPRLLQRTQGDLLVPEIHGESQPAAEWDWRTVSQLPKERKCGSDQYLKTVIFMQPYLGDLLHTVWPFLGLVLLIVRKRDTHYHNTLVAFE